ncbi:MAG: DNA polymerase III subunit delta [Bdellovibrionales bacterium]|nr:DNA polymerase III subunit delta [Bdellovibrionales bacterium]
MASNWDLRRLQIETDRNGAGRLYLLVGEESFLIDESLSVIKKSALQNGPSDFNSDTFYCPEDKAETVRDTVEMLPMMCPQRLVIYKDVQILKEKDWDQLMPVIDEPVETTCFVLVAPKLDKRKKFYKKVSQSGVIVELKRPFDNQIPMWIDYIVGKRGLKIESEARALVQQFVGNNLSEIQSEVGKVHVFLGDRTTITSEDILKVISRSKIESVFDLANAIGKNDRAQALTCLANLLEYGQNEVGALALISRHIRILSILREGKRAGLGGARLSAKAGIPNFFLSEYVNQTRMWTDKKIHKTIHALQETDKALKSSPISSHIWLENFIIKTCTQ